MKITGSHSVVRPLQKNLGRETMPISEIIERIYENQDREHYTDVLIKGLRRIERKMDAKARDEFAAFIPDGDIKAYADKLKENIGKAFANTVKLLKNQEFIYLFSDFFG